MYVYTAESTKNDDYNNISSHIELEPFYQVLFMLLFSSLSPSVSFGRFLSSSPDDDVGCVSRRVYVKNKLFQSFCSYCACASFSLICRLFRHLKFNCARSQLLFANAYYVYLQYEYTNGACTFSLQVFFCSSSLLLNVHGELHNLFAFYVHVCVCREHIFAKGNSFFMFVYGKPICNLDTGFGRHNNVLHKFLLIGNARAHSTHEWCTHDSICGLENTL